MKHGQFTLLVVIGVIALISILTIVYLRTQLTTSQQQQAVQEKIENYLNANNVEQYVKSCLTSVTHAAINTGLRQGGIHWYGQGGPTKISTLQQGTDWQTVNNVNVSYVVKTQRQHLGCDASDYTTTTPAYPRQSLNGNTLTLNDYTPTTAWNICVNPNVGFAGTATLPNLCKLSSSKQPTMTRCNGPYKGPLANGLQSFQASLENYTSTNLATCTQFPNLPEDITIDKTPQVNYSFTDNGVQITAEYPITVTVDDSTTTTTTTFTHAIDADVKQFYEFIHQVLQREANFPTFDINKRSNYKNTYAYKPSYTIQTTDVGPGRLINATVTGVEIGGTPLTFQGLIKNRRPMLNHTKEPIELDKIASSGNTGPNCQASQQLTATLQAVDPDHDTLTWKEQWPGGPTRTGKTKVLTVTANEIQQSTEDNVTVSVTDQHGKTDYQRIETNPTCQTP